MIKPTKEKEANGSVRSISRAADILRCLMNDIDSIKDIAASCGQSKATVHRILGTLEKSDLVFMDPISHKYYLGPFINQLSSIGYNSHKNLIAQVIG